MKVLTFTVVASIVLLAPGILAQNPEADLQRAIQRELVTGDLKAAIEAYGRIAARAGSNRAVAARALVRLANTYQKLGDAESRKIYERVLREFADQSEAVSEARAQLAALRPSPAAQAGRTARQLWKGPEVDPMGSLTPDGRLLSFTDWSTGDLALRDLSTNTSTRLTNTGGWEASADFAEFSVISPDARQIAYAWFTDKDYKYDLRLMPMGGGEPGKPRILHRTAETTWIRPCAWTPDGKTLVVVRQVNGVANQLASIALADGALRVLKELAWQTPLTVSLSPDGRYLAYDLPAGETLLNRDIYVLALDSSKETVVVRSTANDASPLWSTDGSRLLFVSDRSGRDALWSVAVVNGVAQSSAELVAADVRAPLGVAANGSIYYTTGGMGRNVYIADIDAEMRVTSAPKLLSDRFVNTNMSPAWSPDGQSIAYYSARGSRESVGSTVVVVHSIKTGEERDIPLPFPTSPVQMTSVRWFADGRSLLVVGRDPHWKFSYFRVEVASATFELLRKTSGLISAGNQPQLSGDGKSLFYVDMAGPEMGNLMRFDFDNGRETVLKTGYFASLAVSPDNASIAYIGAADPGTKTRHIGIVPTAGGEPRIVYEAPNWLGGSRINTLTWSRDQRYLLFVKEDSSGGSILWRVSAAGGSPVETGIAAPGRIKSPSVHPGGRQLVYAVGDNTPLELWVLDNPLPVTSARK